MERQQSYTDTAHRTLLLTPVACITRVITLTTNSVSSVLPSEKRRELHHPDARFLLATPYPPSTPTPPPPALPTTPPIGFLHLRYLLENNLPTLYAYEMQVDAPWQRLGMGSQLMRVGQLVSVQCGMACVMLTVFKRNEAGMQLYKKTLGYTVDELSKDDHEGEDYEVLSKKNPKFVPAVE